MSEHHCKIAVDDIYYIGVNNTEERFIKWLTFCKFVHVKNCNYSQLGLSLESFSLLLQRAGHVDCFQHNGIEIVEWISIILSILIIFANLFMILIFVKHKNLQTINNIPMLSLNVSDLLIGVTFLYSATWGILISNAQYNLDADRHFIYTAMRSNFYLCMIFEGPVMIFVSLMSSSFALQLIAFERYIAVVHTFKYNTMLTEGRIKGRVCVTWIISIIIGILPMFGWNNYNGVCAMPSILSVSYLSVWSFICFISAILLLYMYLHIFYIAYQHSNTIHALQQSIDRNSVKRESQAAQLEIESITSSTSPATMTSAFKKNVHNGTNQQTQNPQSTNSQVKESQFNTNKIGTIEDAAESIPRSEMSIIESVTTTFSKGHQTENYCVISLPNKLGNQQRQHKGNNSKTSPKVLKTKTSAKPSFKAIQTTGLIIGCFYICWLPFLIYILLYTHSTSCVLPFFCLAVVIQLNSLLNPIIYGYRQTDIRNAGKKLLKLST